MLYSTILFSWRVRLFQICSYNEHPCTSTTEQLSEYFYGLSGSNDMYTYGMCWWVPSDRVSIYIHSRLHGLREKAQVLISFIGVSLSQISNNFLLDNLIACVIRFWKIESPSRRIWRKMITSQSGWPYKREAHKIQSPWEMEIYRAVS